jgi:heme-degrading monooxygenase HmoA
MFARKVNMLLKPNSISRFSLLMEQQVIPMLRNQNGFQDVLTFFAPGEDAVMAISLWDSTSNAEIYSRATYHEVLKRLAAILEGTPKVDTYEVVNSTFHKIAAAAAA